MLRIDTQISTSSTACTETKSEEWLLKALKQYRELSPAELLANSR